MPDDLFESGLLKSVKPVARSRDDDEDGVPIQPISNASLARMVKQREEISSQVTGAINEMEELRSRQKTLEREKNELERLHREQEEYEKGKKEIVEKLNRSLVLLEKEEMDARRMVELLDETRVRFKEILLELSRIDEAGWPDEKFHVELNKAMVMVDIARTDYKKAMAKIDVLAGPRSGGGESPFVKEAVRETGSGLTFGRMVKLGLAFSLPLVLFSMILFMAWLVLRAYGFM